MRKGYVFGVMIGAGILTVLLAAVGIAFAADILTVDKDGTVRLRVSDTGKVTLNTSEASEGDLRFTPRATDPTAPLAGDLWYNSADKEVKYADGGLTKPLAEMTNAAISLYVDGTTGNDNNNGLTSGTAVKTIQKAVNLVPPVVRHAVTINVTAGTYRDVGATIGSTTANVYIADKVVTASGSITFQGGANLATAPSYRVTGSNSGADTTPVRSYGFYVRKVQSVNIRGFQCDYFIYDGVLFLEYSSGTPTYCVCDNNKRSGIYYSVHGTGSPNTCQANGNGIGAGALWPSSGIAYQTYSQGSPSSCTTSGNGGDGMVYTNTSIGWPSACTSNSNAWDGFAYYDNSNGGPSSCTANSNSFYGIRYAFSTGSPTSCTANSNYWHGISVESGSSVSPSGCFLSLNGTSGIGYGISYSSNTIGWPSNCSSPGGNNVSGGLRGDYGARVDYTLPMPNSNNVTGSASSEMY